MDLRERTLLAVERDGASTGSAHFEVSHGSEPIGTFEDRRMRAVLVRWRDGWAAQPRYVDEGRVIVSLVKKAGEWRKITPQVKSTRAITS